MNKILVLVIFVVSVMITGCSNISINGSDGGSPESSAQRFITTIPIDSDYIKYSDTDSNMSFYYSDKYNLLSNKQLQDIWSKHSKEIDKAKQSGVDMKGVKNRSKVVLQSKSMHSDYYDGTLQLVISDNVVPFYDLSEAQREDFINSIDVTCKQYSDTLPCDESKSSFKVINGNLWFVTIDKESSTIGSISTRYSTQIGNHQLSFNRVDYGGKVVCDINCKEKTISSFQDYDKKNTNTLITDQKISTTTKLEQVNDNKTSLQQFTDGNCNRYVKLMECLITKTPSENKQKTIDSFEKVMNQWKGLDPNTLPSTCKSTIDMLQEQKKAFENVGCPL